jgi:hypothetical protein
MYHYEYVNTCGTSYTEQQDTILVPSTTDWMLHFLCCTGWGRPISWPPWFPNLTSLHFFLWGHVQTVVYEGCSKKGLNFLNSMPTSTQRALRLLSAPTGRFWQQTAICPVSVWALVVELHPLNRVRAQAVCQSSDKVTMKELEECVCEILLQTWYEVNKDISVA